MLNIEEKDRTIIFHFSGRLDINYIDSIEKEYLDNIEHLKPEVVIASLSGAEYVSSSAIRLFVATLKMSKTKNFRFILCDLTPLARKIIELVEMNSMFEIYETLEMANKAVS